mmetsp:Transcript_19129/g.60146  ORF Transcript_19129/g.60146 Transcript_19129/m.60146 type:complete len:317 (-) Transcript_19129:59-1009(-)
MWPPLRSRDDGDGSVGPGHETSGESLLVEVSADEGEFALAGVCVVPGGVRVEGAIEAVAEALEDELVGHALDVEDALVAEEVIVREEVEELVEPGVEEGDVDGADEGDGDGGEGRVVPPRSEWRGRVVARTVVEKLRVDLLEDAMHREAVRPDDEGGVDPAAHGSRDSRARVEAGDELLDVGEARLVDQVRLVDDDAIGEENLVDLRLGDEVLGVDHGRDAVYAKASPELAIDAEDAGDGDRRRQARGLDQDRVDVVAEALQGPVQPAEPGAARTPLDALDHGARRVDQILVDADLAELVLDHRTSPLGRPNHVVH